MLGGDGVSGALEMGLCVGGALVAGGSVGGAAVVLGANVAGTGVDSIVGVAVAGDVVDVPCGEGEVGVMGVNVRAGGATRGGERVRTLGPGQLSRARRCPAPRSQQAVLRCVAVWALLSVAPAV